MTRVLAGVKVLEVALYALVPSAAAILSDWGSDVVKVEHSEYGDPMRGNPAWGVPAGINGFTYLYDFVNRGKRSIAVDIGHPDGRDVILELAKDADVFMTNFLPDARAKLGIDASDVFAVNPSIVYARGSGQGQYGPDAPKGGFDGISYWARSGASASLQETGAPWPPPMPGPGFGDVQTGLALAGAISAALLHRERTGKGVEVDASLFGTGLWAMGPTLLAAHLTEQDILPFPDRQTPQNPLANTYRTSDNRFITLAMLQSDKYWQGLCAAMDSPELGADPRFATMQTREENSKACVDALTDTFEKRTLTEWVTRLSAQEGQWDIVRLPGEALADEQALANGYVVDVDYGDGRHIPMVPAPGTFDGQPIALGRAPDHGEHTDEVLLESGMDWDRLINLKLTGAVK